MQEKKGSEKREVLLISFSISARFVFAIIGFRVLSYIVTLFNYKIKHNEIIHYYSGKMNLCQSVYKSDKEISLNE